MSHLLDLIRRRNTKSKKKKSRWRKDTRRTEEKNSSIWFYFIFFYDKLIIEKKPKKASLPKKFKAEKWRKSENDDDFVFVIFPSRYSFDWCFSQKKIWQMKCVFVRCHNGKTIKMHLQTIFIVFHVLHGCI